MATSPAAKRMTFSSDVLFGGGSTLPAGSPSLYDSEPLTSDGLAYQLPSHWYKQPDVCTDEDYQRMTQVSQQEENSYRTNQKPPEMKGNKQAGGEAEVQILEVELEETSQQICTEHDQESSSQGLVPQEPTACCLKYQDMQVCGYEDMSTVQSTDNYSQDCSVEDEQLLPEAETLRQLDGVLREQMNEEIDQFRSNLHSLLTDHYLRHRYFLKSGNLSSDSEVPYGSQSAIPMSDSLCSSGSEACTTSESLASDNENRHGIDIPASVPDRGQEEHLKQQYLISMLTSASIITNALRKKEFSV